MIEKLVFGRTGHMSTRAIFGAVALGRVTQEEADAAIDLLLTHGVNHIDTAASYGDSELRLAPALRRNPGRFFLATKTGERTVDKARDQIHRSLERLGVDSVDLLQLHCLVEPAEWEVAMGPGGALEAAIEARQQGLARFIGVTGHGLSAARMHLRSLERFDFDTVLLPYSYILAQNGAYAAELAALLGECERRGVAVQTIKSVVHRPWGEDPQARATWYRPMEEQRDIDRAVHWVLSRPGIFLNTVGDIHVLPRVLDAAARYEKRPPEEEMRAQVTSLGMAPLFV
ncbi:aldo/keto reductase [Sorangium sp. So ce1182]|uniref:aldo/keto reductase n=1 Tax=Sorangium sp. So ce1182 TaxID=3133334 RepID=UPI003F625814